MENYTREIILYCVFIVSGSFHEAAHAWSAWRLGDSTARDNGRLTLNPLVHIHPIGTVLIPLIIIFYGGLLIGWMRPVPVYPPNLRVRGRDSLFVSLAGPFSNLLLAFFGALVLWVLDGSMELSDNVYFLIRAFMIINLLLAFFNLLPIPPLDGSSIVDFIRRDPNETYHRQAGIGMMILCCMIFLRLFRYLWEVVFYAEIGLMQNPLIAAGLLAAFLIVLVLFARRNKPEGVVVVRKKEPRAQTEASLRLEKAWKIAAAIVKGKDVSKADRQWFARLKNDRGDGEPLCASVSFDIRNEFCRECRNLNRCIIRKAEESPTSADPLASEQ